MSDSRKLRHKNTRYFRDLKSQLKDDHFLQIVRFDTKLIELRSFQQQEKKQLKVNYKHKSFELNRELPQSRQRVHSSEGENEGFYCKRIKRLTQIGSSTVAMHFTAMRRRFRKFVHAVMLMNVYYKYNPVENKKMFRTRRSTMKNSRISIKSHIPIHEVKVPVTNPSIRIKTDMPIPWFESVYKVKKPQHNMKWLSLSHQSMQKPDLKPDSPRKLINTKSNCVILPYLKLQHGPLPQKRTTASIRRHVVK